MSKIKKWSRLLWEAQKFPARYFNPGKQYVYDSGNLPSGITAKPGDILIVNAEPWLPAGCIPGKADDWLVIRNGGTTPEDSLNVPPGHVVANLGESSSVLPKVTIPEFFRQLPLQFLLDYYGYGACRKRTLPDPSWQSCGNKLLRISMPFHNGMRRCLVADDGHVLAYLDATDSTKTESGEPANLSGVADAENPERPFGQVMVELPECFRYHFVENNTEYVYLSSEDFPVDEHVEKVHVPAGCFYSAYEATVDRRVFSNFKLCSVINTSDDFIGGGGSSSQAEWTGDKDLHGRPASTMNLINCRKYARNRGERWNCDTYFLRRHIYWLFVTEYLTQNSQATTDLGEGVVAFESNQWNAFNGMNPFIPCGVTNNLGNSSGKRNYTLESVNKTFYVPSYRGIENPFGHLLSNCDGILIYAADNKNAVYVCDNPAYFSSASYEHYVLLGNAPENTNVYLDRHPGHPIPLGTSTATATTGMCDSFFAPIANSGINRLFFGGCGYLGAASGLSCIFAESETRPIREFHGTRLCYLPF